NAQNLRILTRLEAKAIGPDGRSAGLNLTRALLDAATKYPWTRRSDTVKFGAYADDVPVFSWLRIGAPAEPVKCFEAQIMDWSDDVAYSVHDLEDAIYAGHLAPKVLLVDDERAALFERALGYAPDAGQDEFAAALDRLQSVDWWPGEYDRSFAAQARLKRAASELIGRFCLGVVYATRAEFGPGPHTRYNARLVVPRELRLENAVLKAVAARYVMETEPAYELRARQAGLIRELVSLLADRPDQLEPAFHAWWSEAPDDAARLRVVVDQIASLTDASARRLHGRLLARI
ncbi:MAG: deoxyguanosinetriphosphate triphosphohydrolase, partial [Actinocrinis sp.]